jgi:hypothetical protein
MPKSNAKQLSDDFQDVVNYLGQRKLISSDPGEFDVAIAAEIHGLTYSAILWKFRIKDVPPHGKYYLDEIASDALQILPQVTAGFSKTSKLLIRGVIENALRYIYFSDHPIEFIRMNRDKKWFVTIDQLFEYLKNHPFFVETEVEFDAISRLRSLYSDISAGVHGRTVSHLELREALAEIVFNATSAHEDLQFLRRCVESVNFLLAILNKKRVKELAAHERKIVLGTLPRQARKVWADYEPK